MKFRRLKPNEIDLRIGTVSAQAYGVSLLLYKNARVDMQILDETVGAENWQREHYEVKGNLYCRVGIKCGDEWVWKADCGTESNTEKEKGESSDSFKRACVCWGIGRELYTAPFIWIAVGKDMMDNGKLSRQAQKEIANFRVESIEYNEQGEIIDLVIVDKTGMVAWRK